MRNARMIWLIKSTDVFKNGVRGFLFDKDHKTSAYICGPLTTALN